MPATTNQAADDLLRKEFKCLDKGHVTLIDYMGGDDRIVQAARVSYGDGTKTKREDAALIDYLMRNKHTSPFEQVVITFHMKMPIFVARQIIRHRTARCLAADTVISFDLTKPNSDFRHSPLTIKQLWDRWQPSVNKIPSQQRNPFFKKERVQGMKLRYLDMVTGEVKHTKLLDVVHNGKQQLWKVTFADGKTLRATEDHVVFTDRGEMSLRDAYEDGALFITTGKSVPAHPELPPYTAKELANEEWRVVPEFEGKYLVSNLGRIKTTINTRNGILDKPQLKKITICKKTNYAVVSLSTKGKSYLRSVHRLVLETFVGPRPNNMEARHLDSIRCNPRLSNLEWGTTKENAEDRVASPLGGHQRLSACFVEAVSMVKDKVEDVYDLIVDNENHNFFANGILVHNCNEISGRYSILKDEFYVPLPDRMQKQHDKNKQGSADELIENPQEWTEFMADEQASAYAQYQEYLETGLSRELSRINLPLSTYTEWYWQIDLHNLFHFLRLRLDSHAQYEVRVYAQVMAEIAKVIAPSAYAAAEEHILHAKTFSRTELRMIEHIIKNHPYRDAVEDTVGSYGCNREFKSYITNLLETN